MDEVNVAVLLADISGSTALYEDVGNVAALRLVSECLSLIRKSVDAHGGKFISSKGDDVLCTFETPEAAINVGIEVLEAIRGGPISLHAGIDFGPVILARDDVFGDSVNMAARLSTLAKSGEIICSQAFYTQLEGSHRALLRFFGTRQFKGRDAVSNVYLFSDAPPGQVTEIMFSEASSGAGNGSESLDVTGARAALRFGAETFVCRARKPVTLGRSFDQDLVVPLPWVSRSHAILEVQQEKVYLIDTSSSGTYLSFERGTPVLVRRETVLLTNSCSLSLARPPGEEGAQEISCELLQPAPSS